ncbi:LrgB family protein [Pontibacillus yanchengensis]|uniref:LrgB n=1 Tax=Pontibacillus yanchengensis Y32 TaxID=1385514 RepID=A0A0A2TEA0_9BACI|nr:LrgB family protein [Pontibacillus yanchengensis]KGP72396.1 hypothetical protein N782_12115 [Pontibacillus yanchengensis Y32]
MSNIMIGMAAIIGTLLIYIGSLNVYRRLRSPITLPVLVSTITVSLLLLVSDIPYDTYMKGGAWIDWFLGPAVVALAYPLYKQRAILKRFMFLIVSSVTVGAVIGVSSGILLLKWADFEPSIIYSLVPKNATTPVAMPVAQSLGGVPSLAAVFVIFAGIVGAVLVPSVFKWMRITHFLGKGIGMGTASHAIGTSKAMENSEREGAVSTVAMILCAIIISLISPFLVFLLL